MIYSSKMKMQHRCSSLIIFGLGFITACKTQNEIETPKSFVMQGTLLATIPTNQVLPDGLNATKTIRLNNITVTSSFLQSKTERVLSSSAVLTSEIDYSDGIIPFQQSPDAVDLGMANVPVLDQGSYGTCVTFAATSILDAILEKGDMISQQCILALNKGLGDNYWNGAQHALQILRPLRKYGLVEKSRCISDYPDDSKKMTQDEYGKIASRAFSVTTITGNFIEPINLDIIRSMLNKKHRVALGFGLKKDYSSLSVSGFDLSINNDHKKGGLWACEQPGSSVNYCGIPNAGHEVVVIGYDDSQQLLKIRNSWGDMIGDEGDFYMTYHFFNAMSFNGTEVYASEMNL